MSCGRGKSWKSRKAESEYLPFSLHRSRVSLSQSCLLSKLKPFSSCVRSLLPMVLGRSCLLYSVAPSPFKTFSSGSFFPSVQTSTSKAARFTVSRVSYLFKCIDSSCVGLIEETILIHHIFLFRHIIISSIAISSPVGFGPILSQVSPASYLMIQSGC